MAATTGSPEDLTRLVDEWLRGHDTRRQDILDLLNELAIALRDETIRASYGERGLSTDLVRLMSFPYEDVRGQVGRAAANLAIDSDTNRQRLVDSGYISAALSLDSTIPFVIASLHNLAIDSHPAVIKALRQGDNWLRMVQLAAKCAGEDPGPWCWMILSCVYENESTPPLRGDILDNLLIPLTLWPNVDDCVLSACARIVEIICADTAAPRLFSYDPRLQIVLDFVESAQSEAAEGALGQAKGVLVRAMVELSTGIPREDGTFWERMKGWLRVNGREDLLDCALLSLGNSARSDVSAVQLLQQEDLLSTILRLLDPLTPARTQHAVLSLLRNLSIPEENRIVLGEARVIEKIMQMGVWASDRDMLGSVQGGAIGIIKNLCRFSANAETFVGNTVWIDSLLDLLNRTDDQALRLEGTRIFVNTIRTLAQSSKTPAPTNLRVVELLARMLRESEQYPVLQNESIIALTLLATFGSEETASTISSLDLDMRDITEPRIKENAAALQSITTRYTK